MNYEYIIILFFLLIISVFIEKRFRIQLYHCRHERFWVVLTFFIIGILWDTFATLRGHWIFPRAGTLGIIIGVLPIEEYIFMLVFPFFLITLYKLLVKKIK